MKRYALEPRTRKYLKGYRFLSFERNQCKKYENKLQDTVISTGLDAANTASKKVVKKTFEATEEFIEKKIAE